MAEEGADFEDVLKEAQEKGYAERNPEADVKFARAPSIIHRIPQHIPMDKYRIEYPAHTIERMAHICVFGMMRT